MGFAALFLLFAALLTAGTVLAGGAWWLALLVFVLGFLLAHVLFLAVAALLCRGTELDQPGAKLNPYAAGAAAATGRFLCAYAGMRAHIQGAEKLPQEGRFLFVCNHRSMFDPLMVMGYLSKWEITFVSKPSNLQIPLVGSIARAAGFLAINRENDREALKTILTAASRMKNDVCSIGIYPEGTRSRSGELLPFHKGSFKIAQRAGTPLVIACVRGSEKLRKGFLLHPHAVWLDILEVVPTERVKAMSTQELAEFSRACIQNCLDSGEGNA